MRLLPRPPLDDSGPELTDEDVLEAFESADAARAELLYAHLIGVVEATVYKVLGRREQDHDDLVQNVFEQLLLTLKRRRFARACSLRSWAASIACHVALNALRSRGTERKFFEREEELDVRLRFTAADGDPERGTTLSRELEHLRRELSALPTEQAQALLLHDALGYELAEIAVLTNASIAAAQSRLVRGRKELRRRLLALGLGTREAT